MKWIWNLRWLANHRLTVGALKVGLLFLLEAVIGPLLVWLVVGESPGRAALAGGAVVLLLLVTVNVAALRAARSVPPVPLGFEPVEDLVAGGNPS